MCRKLSGFSCTVSVKWKVTKFEEKRGNLTAERNLVQLQSRKQYVVVEFKKKIYNCWRWINTYFSSGGCKMAWPRIRREAVDDNHRKNGISVFVKRQRSLFAHDISECAGTTLCYRSIKRHALWNARKFRSLSVTTGPVMSCLLLEILYCFT